MDFEKLESEISNLQHDITEELKSNVDINAERIISSESLSHFASLYDDKILAGIYRHIENFFFDLHKLLSKAKIEFKEYLENIKPPVKYSPNYDDEEREYSMLLENKFQSIITYLNDTHSNILNTTISNDKIYYSKYKGEIYNILDMVTDIKNLLSKAKKSIRKNQIDKFLDRMDKILNFTEGQYKVVKNLGIKNFPNYELEMKIAIENKVPQEIKIEEIENEDLQEKNKNLTNQNSLPSNIKPLTLFQKIKLKKLYFTIILVILSAIATIIPTTISIIKLKKKTTKKATKRRREG